MWGHDNGVVVGQGGSEGLAGVAITNLPSDCTEREMKNLGAFLPGFHSSEVMLQRERPEATFWFASLKFAKMAVERLQGFKFDEQVRLQASLVGEGALDGKEVKNSSLLMAESGQEGAVGGVGGVRGAAGMETRSTRNPRNASNPTNATNASNVVDGHRGSNSAQNSMQNTMPTYMQHPMHDAHGTGSKPQMMAATGPYFYAPAVVVPNVGSMPGGMVHNMATNMMPTNHQGNPPCNTLFVGNLTVAVTEEELEDVFCRFEGFVKVKLAQTRKGMSAFVEYNTVENAVDALQKTQNVVLESSGGRGAIRVQFSKNPLGSRGDSRMIFAPVAGVQVPHGAPPVSQIAQVAPVGSVGAPPVGAAVGAPPGMYFVQTPGMSFPNDHRAPRSFSGEVPDRSGSDSRGN